MLDKKNIMITVLLLWKWYTMQVYDDNKFKFKGQCMREGYEVYRVIGSPLQNWLISYTLSCQSSHTLFRFSKMDIQYSVQSHDNVSLNTPHNYTFTCIHLTDAFVQNNVQVRFSPSHSRSRRSLWDKEPQHSTHCGSATRHAGAWSNMYSKCLVGY